MKIIGIDLSLTSTGYSINGDTGVISTKARGAERLSYISVAILDLCKQFSIDVAVIEGYSFASRNSQAHSIGELGGAVRMRLWENGFRYIDAPPTCRAKFATGKGNASKNEVISAISARTGIVWSGAGSDDRCDAWILEQMGLAAIGKPTYEWPAENLSALKKIDWSPMDGLLPETL